MTFFRLWLIKNLADVLSDLVHEEVGLELQKVFWRMKKWLHSYFKGLFCPFFNYLK